jgi:hypothetical protein
MDEIDELVQSRSEVDHTRVVRYPALEEFLAQQAPERVLGATIGGVQAPVVERQDAGGRWFETRAMLPRGGKSA